MNHICTKPFSCSEFLSRNKWARDELERIDENNNKIQELTGISNKYGYICLWELVDELTKEYGFELYKREV